MRLAGLDLGERYQTPSAAKTIEFLAMKADQIAVADRLSEPLPGMGIPTDLNFGWDGISIGKSSFSTQETLMVIGAGFVDSRCGRLSEALISAPSANLLHTGEAQRNLVFSELSRHPGSKAY